MMLVDSASERVLACADVMRIITRAVDAGWSLAAWAACCKATAAACRDVVPLAFRDELLRFHASGGDVRKAPCVAALACSYWMQQAATACDGRRRARLSGEFALTLGARRREVSPGRYARGVYVTRRSMRGDASVYVWYHIGGAASSDPTYGGNSLAVQVLKNVVVPRRGGGGGRLGRCPNEEDDLAASTATVVHADVHSLIARFGGGDDDAAIPAARLTDFAAIPVQHDIGFAARAMHRGSGDVSQVHLDVGVFRSSASHATVTVNAHGAHAIRALSHAVRDAIVTDAADHHQQQPAAAVTIRCRGATTPLPWLRELHRRVRAATSPRYDESIACYANRLQRLHRRLHDGVGERRWRRLMTSSGVMRRPWTRSMTKRHAAAC